MAAQWKHDSMGDVEVPEDALYGAQTQRAIRNFQIGDVRFPRAFLRAMGMIKAAAAQVNGDLKLLPREMASAIGAAALEVEEGKHDAQFPLDVFQTGSGTSIHMNANEVIATLASRTLGRPVHPNDHVNLGQSSNDVIPTAIHLSAVLETAGSLLPSLRKLSATIAGKAAGVNDVVKTGRTHLMDAVPIRMSQELGGWAQQVNDVASRIKGIQPRLLQLAIGGTAVGTGLNTHPEFGVGVARRLASVTGMPFVTSTNPFAAISSQDTAVELSGILKTGAVALMKISNDLRWMASGPTAGLAEIRLPALQPGSSIMPGKVNPVIPEAVAMACAQIIGLDAAITIAGQSGNFQLNVMLPLIAYDLLTSIQLLARSAEALATQAIEGMEVSKERLRRIAALNPILATALNPHVGYEAAAEIARMAALEGASVVETAARMTNLRRDDLERILDPMRLTNGGIAE